MKSDLGRPLRAERAKPPGVQPQALWATVLGRRMRNICFETLPSLKSKAQRRGFSKSREKEKVGVDGRRMAVTSRKEDDPNGSIFCFETSTFSRIVLQQALSVLHRSSRQVIRGAKDWFERSRGTIRSSQSCLGGSEALRWCLMEAITANLLPRPSKTSGSVMDPSDRIAASDACREICQRMSTLLLSRQSFSAGALQKTVSW